MRLQVRQQIAQQLGVNPADVSASAVAAQVPAIYKAMKPSMRIVHDLLDKSYPEKAIEWIGQMDWGFRKSVPLEDISVTGPSSESDAKSIRKKVKKMRKGKPVKPLILIDPGDGGLLQVADGHHRCAAALEADLTEVPAYVGKPHTDDDWRKEVMDMQMVRAKKGALNMFSGVKNFSASMGFAPFDLSGPEVPVKFAGLLLMARNTGRVLMIQRYLEEDDPAAGQWEFPGGHLEGDEEALEGAMREWREEVGSELPPMRIVGRWLSPNGYMGFFAVCSSESDVDIHSRDIVNPDDPDQDNPEAVAWFYPGDLASMPGLRKETRDFTPWSRIIGKAVQAA
jgi:8-oxo-dGTP pyrophosphatase MutT (NUDIX family)